MKFHSKEVIEKLKEEIPKREKVIQGITHLQIKLKDGGIKQIGNFFLKNFFYIKINCLVSVLILERGQVIEPQTLLKKNQIYADVFIEIHDQVLAGRKSRNEFEKSLKFMKFTDIASKDICIYEAIEKKMFSVYGDDEIWKLQLAALKKVLPTLSFKTREERLKKKEKIYVPATNYRNLPITDLSDVPSEFKMIADHFESLRKKYNFNIDN